MTWGNHGEWHIDHIIPLREAKNEEDIMLLNRYDNLQPLWATDNLKKGCRLYNPEDDNNIECRETPHPDDEMLE